jgi:hypothetical protein
MRGHGVGSRGFFGDCIWTHTGAASHGRKSSESTIVLPDSVYTKENIEKNIPAGNCWDPGQSMVSMHRLITLLRGKRRLFITHDPEAWNDLKPLPIVIANKMIKVEIFAFLRDYLTPELKNAERDSTRRSNNSWSNVRSN